LCFGFIEEGLDEIRIHIQGGTNKRGGEIDGFGEIEVTNDALVVVEEDVLQFDIPMDDLKLVNVLQSLQDLLKVDHLLLKV
jgi:hypothetical protein